MTEEEGWKYVDQAVGWVSDPLAIVALLLLLGIVILLVYGPGAWAQVTSPGWGRSPSSIVPPADRVDILALRNKVDDLEADVVRLQREAERLRGFSSTHGVTLGSGGTSERKVLQLEQDVFNLAGHLDELGRTVALLAERRQTGATGEVTRSAAAHSAAFSPAEKSPFSTAAVSRHSATPPAPPFDPWPATARDLIQAWSQSMSDGRLDVALFHVKAGAVRGAGGYRRHGSFAIVEFTHGDATREFAVPIRSEGYQAGERYDCTDDDRDATIEAIEELAVYSDSAWSRGRVRTRKNG